MIHDVVRGGKDDPGCKDTTPFLDVAASDIFCGDIAWLKDQAITQGYSQGTFEPTSTVTRQAMAAFLHRLTG